MPKRGPKRVKKAVFADEEEEDNETDEIDEIDEIEIDEGGSHPLTSNSGHPATHEDTAATSAPTSAAQTQDEMPTTKETQSSKAQKGTIYHELPIRWHPTDPLFNRFNPSPTNSTSKSVPFSPTSVPTPTFIQVWLP